MAKKKLLMIAIPAVLLLGGAGAFFGGVFGGEKAEAVEDTHTEAPPQEAANQEKHVFYELPDIVVNLNSKGKRRGNLLKIKINLELEDEASVKTVEAMMPRIIDNLQVYLRELKIDDLQGSEGLYRLREELLHRVNTAANPAKINSVLFSEMLMQ